MSDIEPFELMEVEGVEMNSTAGRRGRLFTVSEKILLQKLVLQYRVHTKNLSIACRKSAWERLTQDFNSYKGFNRTEVQLKKCWDNIKTRRRHILRQQSRSSAPHLVETSQNTEYKEADLVSDPLMSVKQEEITWNDDDDDSPPKQINVSKVPVVADAASPLRGSTALPADEFSPFVDRLQVSSAGPASPQFESTRLPDEELPRVSARLQHATHSPGCYKRKHNNTCAAPKEKDRSQERTEELHRLKVAEQVWMLKTLRERHATARLERERAHHESERAKLELEKARFERDAAQYQREKALLELDRAKRIDASVIYNKNSSEVPLH